MADCDICEMIDKKESFKIVYEDQVAIAFLNETPLMEGHVMLMAKQHFSIIEQIPDQIWSHLMNVSNIISVALFDSTKAEGTNIIINNGVDAGQKFPHTIVNIIPRKTGDGVKLDWELKKASAESIKMNADLLGKYAGKINLKDDPATKPVIKEEKPSAPEIKAEDNYKIRQLKRIP